MRIISPICYFFAFTVPLLIGVVGTAQGVDKPVVLCNVTNGDGHLIAATWDIENIGDGLAIKISFEGTYHEDEAAARVTGYYFQETLNPGVVELKFDVSYVEPDACSWTFDGVRNAGADEYIGTWTHTVPQNCGNSGSYTFVWGICPDFLPQLVESLSDLGIYRTITNAANH